MTQEVLKLALEALEELTDTEQTHAALDRGDAAITAIKEALAEDVPEVGFGNMAEQPAQPPVAKPHEQEPDDFTVWRSRALQAEAVIDKFMAQPQQNGDNK